MGSATWDKRFVADSLVQYSSVLLDAATELFILHRELSIPKSKVHHLAMGLTNDKLFTIRIPKFLRHCKKHVTKPLGAGFGLEELAKLIEDGKLTGKSEWRFAISPIPRSIKKHPRTKYFLEIQFVMDPRAAFKKTKLPDKEANEAIEHLKLSGASVSKEFLSAIGKLATAYKPVSGAFLHSVFAPASLMDE